MFQHSGFEGTFPNQWIYVVTRIYSFVADVGYLFYKLWRKAFFRIVDSKMILFRHRTIKFLGWKSFYYLCMSNSKHGWFIFYSKFNEIKNKKKQHPGEVQMVKFDRNQNVIYRRYKVLRNVKWLYIWRFDNGFEC